MNKTVRSNKIKEAENHLYTPVFSFIPRYLICSSVWEQFFGFSLNASTDWHALSNYDTRIVASHRILPLCEIEK